MGGLIDLKRARLIRNGEKILRTRALKCALFSSKIVPTMTMSTFQRNLQWLFDSFAAWNSHSCREFSVSGISDTRSQKNCLR